MLQRLRLKKLLTQTFVCCALVLGVFMSEANAASNFTVSPLLIERSTEARDMFSRTITVTNQTSNALRVYASVHEVRMGEDTEVMSFIPPSMSNRATSITSWIEITRGRLEIPAQGSLQVPLQVKIHPYAPAGTYYAFIGFATGHNRDAIEKTIMSGGGSGVILKLSIDENQTEQAQLVSFVTDRFSIAQDRGFFSYIVENSGETPITPSGEVIIYDQRGKELTSVPVNTAGTEIMPGERIEFKEALPFLDRIGRNKASLNIQYGAGTAAVFDTSFYYSVPWYYVALFVFVLLLLFIMVLFVVKQALSRAGDHESGTIYEVPVFVKKSTEHATYDHDINLKHDTSRS